jgi:hypothetical protein
VATGTAMKMRFYIGVNVPISTSGPKHPGVFSQIPKPRRKKETFPVRYAYILFSIEKNL